jgi:hypothetical protein
LKNRSIAAALAFALFAALFPHVAFAWGYIGHSIISRLAAESLPQNVPAFVRTPAAIDEIATLGPEEDRIKGAGRSWDDDNDAGHYLDIGDDGTVAGVVRLDALPKDMQAYADALAKAGTNPYRVGYVPYTIMDGFERVRQDFAIWRVDDYLATHAATQSARDEFAKDRALREVLTLRDIGDWSHFVGDGSQPLHITYHFNGWGNYPNPNNYTTEHIHSPFETAFVNKYAKIDDVRAAMPMQRLAIPDHLLSQEEIAALVGGYLSETSQQVAPLYKLWGAQAFQNGSPEAVKFTDEQLAHGASMLRQLIFLAYENSLYANFGYPEVPVRDILSGKVVPTGATQSP